MPTEDGQATQHRVTSLILPTALPLCHSVPPAS